MKKFSLFLLSVVISGVSFAAPVTKLPKEPPPYGAYAIGGSRSVYFDTKTTETAIAQHYGFKTSKEAALACFKVRHDCDDIVRHMRDKDPVVKADLKKYGLPSWDGAVNACIKNLERGDLPYCQVDPFLKLRLGLQK